MIPLAQLISEYPILLSLSPFVSALDLLNIALTCKANYLYIASSKRIFNVLRRQSLCDGHGLAERQAFAGLYSLEHRHYNWGGERHIWQDEAIEVYLYNLKCDEAAALPCCKCGINICEECRYYPREPPHKGYPTRRPHLNSPWQSENVMCLCTECDVAAENELRGQFLNELCDCDIYERWICPKCVKREHQFTREYYKNHTKYDEFGDTRQVGDHQGVRDVSSNPLGKIFGSQIH
jgi:hypothetical protein